MNIEFPGVINLEFSNTEPRGAAPGSSMLRENLLSAALRQGLHLLLRKAKNGRYSLDRTVYILKIPKGIFLRAFVSFDRVSER